MFNTSVYLRRLSACTVLGATMVSGCTPAPGSAFGPSESFDSLLCANGAALSPADPLNLAVADAGTGAEILRVDGFAFETGRTLNLRGRRKEGDETLRFDTVEGLSVGDTLTLVNERRGGRLNAPQSEDFEIAAVDSAKNVLTLAAPLGDAFSSKQALIVRDTAPQTYCLGAVDRAEDGTLSFDIRTDGARYDVTLGQDAGGQNAGEVAITATGTFTTDTELYRSTLFATPAEPLSRVFQRNGKVQERDFAEHYWMDRGGAEFGDDDSALRFYNLKGVTSVELKPGMDRARLELNLDHHLDHPFRRLNRDTGVVDMFASRLGAGDTTTHDIRFQYGRLGPQPRLMPTRAGRLATFIWSEHGDFSTLAGHRAAMYGSSEITRWEDATGGFGGYDIPITKSVFYTNPDAVVSRFYPEAGPVASLVHEEPFGDMLDDLEANGVEVVMHTTSPFSNPADTQAGIDVFKERFDARSWIDHRMLRVEDSLSNSGFLPDGPLSRREAWADAGVRYFWHSGSEDHSITQFGKRTNLDVLMTTARPDARAPLYWRHPTVLGDIVSWPAMPVRRLSRQLTDEALDELVGDWGVHINHVYSSAVGNTLDKGFFLRTAEDGTGYRSDPAFDAALARLAARRDATRATSTL